MTDLEEIPENAPEEAPAHPHCWHLDTALDHAASLPLVRDVCCHCGVVKTRHADLPAIPEGHGAFFPRPTRVVWQYGDPPRD